MNLSQCTAVREVHLIGSQSPMIYNSKQLSILILQPSMKSQIEVLNAQQDLLPNLIHNYSLVPIGIVLLGILGLRQTSLHQQLDVLHTFWK